jgi:hypothetical protein
MKQAISMGRKYLSLLVAATIVFVAMLSTSALADNPPAQANPGGGTGEPSAQLTERCRPYQEIFTAQNQRANQLLMGEVDQTHKNLNRPSIAGAYCTEFLLDALDLFSSLLNGGWLTAITRAAAAFVMGLIVRLAQQVCNYVVSQINNVLALACIPIPKLGLPGFGFGANRRFCDGLQLVGPIPTPPINLAPAFVGTPLEGVNGYYGIPSLSSLTGPRRQTSVDLWNVLQGK